MKKCTDILLIPGVSFPISTLEPIHVVSVLACVHGRLRQRERERETETERHTERDRERENVSMEPQPKHVGSVEIFLRLSLLFE